MHFFDSEVNIPLPDITPAFDTLVGALREFVIWMKIHGFYFHGTLYSFFNLALTASVAAYILIHLPVWEGAGFDDSPFDTDFELDEDQIWHENYDLDQDYNFDDGLDDDF